MELEFLNIPFDSMDFKDVSEVAYAMNLYKTSRLSFYEEFGCVKLEDLSKRFDEQLEYLLDRRDEFLSSRVQEINLIQNPYFYNELVKYEFEKSPHSKDEIKNRLYELDISEINSIEPAQIGKRRARVQALVYSVGLYLEESLRSIDIPKNTWESVRAGIENLDAIVRDIKHNIFKYYNEAITRLPSILKDTMGENVHISKLHQLKNVMEDYPGSGSPICDIENYSENTPQVGYVLFGIKPAVYQTIKKDGDKSTKNRVYGILLPLERVGNEKLSLLYKRIICNNVDISNLFSDSLSNVKAKDHRGQLTYFKSLMIKPLWMLFADKSLTQDEQDILSKIIGISCQDINDNLDKRALSVKINATCTNFLNLSRDHSTILVAKTRSEEDYLQEAVEIASGRINDIYMAFATND